MRRFVDRRPFFTMKLVKGRTLAELIRSRSDSGDDLPRFLNIFESICQTIEAVDERVDVFGLGAILCEILTGHPAFVGRVVSETMRKAERGELAEAFARLDGCDAEPELVALARNCLAPVYLDRPRRAGIVAERMTAYLTGVQERLRNAELARAKADARAQEERKRRRLAMALAAAILLLMAVGGTGAAVYVQHRRDQTSRLELALREVHLLRAQALATGDPAKGAQSWRRPRGP